MHVMIDRYEQTGLADMKVHLTMYVNVSEVHEWRSFKLKDFSERLERAITREFSKPIKEKHRVLLDRDEDAI